MKKMRMILLFILMGVCVTSNAVMAEQWRFPGEFEPQEAVWVGWLTKEYVRGHETDPVLLAMVKALVPHVDVVIGVPCGDAETHVRSVLAKARVPMDRIRFFRTPFAVPYWRDYGPIFVKNGQGKLKIIDFCFNCWGYYPIEDLQSRTMEEVDRKVARHLGLNSDMTRVVSEGGDRILNGRGTLITVEACEFQRNPNVSRAHLEKEYRRLLGVSNIIWLKQGTYDDDAYNVSTLPGPGGKGIAFRSAAANNHADEFCRFVDAETILLAQVTEEEAAGDPIAAENRRRMEENFAILSAARDQDGNPFRIIRIPMPETMYFKAVPSDECYTALFSSANYTDGNVFPMGEPVMVVPAMSYCNFLISNGVILAQKYWSPGMPETIRKKDEAAQAVLQKAFPNRKVVAVNTLALNFGGGGIHCATQQQPVK